MNLLRVHEILKHGPIVYLEVFLMVVMVAAPGGYADIQAGNGISCVQNITINSEHVEKGWPYNYTIHMNNSQCSPEQKPLKGRILECEKGYGRGSFSETEGKLCPVAKCQRLEVDGISSSPIYTPDCNLDVSLNFREFNNKGLHLGIKSDKRIRSWNLTIFTCLKEDCTGCAEKKLMDDVGNQTVLKIEEHFVLDECYCFRLVPNIYGTCEPSLSRYLFKHLTSCFPQDWSERQDNSIVINKGSSWWVVPFGVLVAVEFLVCTSVAVSAAWKYFRTEKFKYTTPTAAGEVRRTSPSVLILYAQDIVAHLSQVSQLKMWLKDVLLCEVFDIFDDTNLEKLADPSWWLQEIISKSSVKIVLVLSPQIENFLHPLIATDAKPDISPDCLSQELNNKLLLAGIKYLLQPGLVVNYDRVFTVSFGTVNVGSNAGPLVESRRYILPQHQYLFAAALMEGCKNNYVPCYFNPLGMKCADPSMEVEDKQQLLA
ncbi:uncharacterized protein LOC127004526 isoform X2 [Eriocheir sinensis]|uniref:uncharacterized protein LOC127004526 isoform X2 n=1 Tax=Eriocheir sinensis TaxID=95602 RepID=UPI0021C7C801|nr:uncharacterized protein LOC127004526 isoform X2 [Eriocheir sinensis]